MKSKILLALMLIIIAAFIAGMIFLIVRLVDYVMPVEPENETENSEPVTETSLETTALFAPTYPYANTGTMDETKNTDMIGWLHIPNTKIDYPVMQSYEDPDFYLSRDFYKTASPYGCPYLQSNCNPLLPSDNLIVYAHDMDDGTMFAPLRQYKDFDFYKKHKTVTLEIDNKVRSYSVLAFIVLPYTTDDKASFKFYEFVDAYDPKSFNDFVSECKSLSLYDTGVNAKYGDKLLTLATAEYNSDKERLLLIAKQI